MKPVLTIALLIGAGAFLFREQIAEALNGDLDQVLPPVTPPAPATTPTTPPPAAYFPAVLPPGNGPTTQIITNPEYVVDYGHGRTRPVEVVGPSPAPSPMASEAMRLLKTLIVVTLQKAGMPNAPLTADQWNYYYTQATGKAAPELHNPANRGELISIDTYMQRLEAYTRSAGSGVSGVRHRLTPMSGLRSWR